MNAKIKALKDENQFVREGTARILGKLGNPKAVELLIELLNGKLPSVKTGSFLRAVASSLEFFALPPLWQPIHRALRDGC